MISSRDVFVSVVAIAALYAAPDVAYGADGAKQDQQIAQTQQTAQAQRTQQQTGATLEEITVTAQRRAENLQVVPIAITALTANELEQRQVTRTLDLLQYVPNIVGHNNTGLGTANTYYIRGIGSTESIAVIDPPVGTYVDEFFNARQIENNFEFFDLDRIEVLRGPQGTLYGRNTTGGSINMYMKKPSDTYDGYAEIGYGKYDEEMGRTSVDIPVLPDKLLTKWSAFYIHDDGYVYNETTHQHENYQHDYGLRGAIEAIFSDTAKWDFSTDYMDENYANLINFPGPNGGRVDYTPQLVCCGLGLGKMDPKLANIGLGNDARTVQAISNFSIELNENTAMNIISGYHHLHQDFMTDSGDGLNSAAPNVVAGVLVNVVPGNSTPLATDAVSDEFTQEIKLNGKIANGALDYVGGFYFFYEKSATDLATDTITPAGVATVQADRTVSNETDAYAGYFQGDWHITSAFKATAGMRYTAEFKSISFTPDPNPLPTLNAPFSTINILNEGIPDTLQAKVWTPRFALNYQVTDDALLYATATKGFKSGGWNSRSVAAEQATTFGPEINWTYEGGVKSDWFSNHLRANLNFFYMNDEHFQGSTAVIDRVSNLPVFLTENFANLHDYGFEGEITAVPTDKLNIYLSFGSNHANYADLSPGTQAQLAACQANPVSTNTANCNVGIVTSAGTIGRPVRIAPFDFTTGFTYKIALGGSLELDPNASWNWTHGSWTSAPNTVGAYQQAHSLIDAGIALRDTDKRWSLMADCTNCFNKTFVASYLTFQYLNEPGRWMIHAKYEF